MDKYSVETDKYVVFKYMMLTLGEYDIPMIVMATGFDRSTVTSTVSCLFKILSLEGHVTRTKTGRLHVYESMFLNRDISEKDLRKLYFKINSKLLDLSRGRKNAGKIKASEKNLKSRALDYEPEPFNPVRGIDKVQAVPTQEQEAGLCVADYNEPVSQGPSSIPSMEDIAKGLETGPRPEPRTAILEPQKGVGQPWVTLCVGGLVLLSFIAGVALTIVAMTIKHGG
jgi:hypothetical protein